MRLEQRSGAPTPSLVMPGPLLAFPPAVRRCFDLGNTILSPVRGAVRKKTTYADNGGSTVALILQHMRERQVLPPGPARGLLPSGWSDAPSPNPRWGQDHCPQIGVERKAREAALRGASGSEKVSLIWVRSVPARGVRDSAFRGDGRVLSH
jgi:hypothetical protein